MYFDHGVNIPYTNQYSNFLCNISYNPKPECFKGHFVGRFPNPKPPKIRGDQPAGKKVAMKPTKQEWPKSI